MPLINIVISLIVVGVLLWLVNNYIPMDSKIKSILNVVVVVGVVLWLLSAFGLLGSLSSYRVGALSEHHPLSAARRSADGASRKDTVSQEWRDGSNQRQGQAGCGRLSRDPETGDSSVATVGSCRSPAGAQRSSRSGDRPSL